MDLTESQVAALRKIVADEAWELDVDETQDLVKRSLIALEFKATYRAEKELARLDGLLHCTCGRPAQGNSCRCYCPRCGSTNLRWERWGSYLDKDLVCQKCRYEVSSWDCG